MVMPGERHESVVIKQDNICTAPTTHETSKRHTKRFHCLV